MLSWLAEPRAFVADVAEAWRSSGARAAWNEFREWVVYPIFRHGRVVVIAQEMDALAQNSPPPGVEVRPFAGTDWSPLVEIANQRTRARFRRAAARGRICFVAWRGRRPIGYVWLSERIDPDLELYPLPLPEDAVYGWDVYVTPDERGRGIAPALIGARLRYARDRGFRTSWRAIAPDNAASFGAVRKTSRDGMQIVGELSYARVLGRVFARGSLRPVR